MRKALARTIVESKRDAEERVQALRLQVMAWRQLAMIALVDQETARKNAKWLLFSTIPFTNGPAVEKFIVETESAARECAVKAGVVTEVASPSPAKQQQE